MEAQTTRKPVRTPSEVMIQRRLSQTKRRTELSNWYKRLRTLLPNDDLEPHRTKIEILKKAKRFIQNLEETLTSLLEHLGETSTAHSHPANLHDVGLEFLQLYYSGIEPPPRLSDDSIKCVQQENFLAELRWFLVHARDEVLPTVSPGNTCNQTGLSVFLDRVLEMLGRHGIVSSQRLSSHNVLLAINKLWADTWGFVRADDELLDLDSMLHMFLSPSSQLNLQMLKSIDDDGHTEELALGTSSRYYLITTSSDMEQLLGRPTDESIPHTDVAAVVKPSSNGGNLYLTIVKFLLDVSSHGDAEGDCTKVTQGEFTVEDSTLLRCTETFEEDDI